MGERNNDGRFWMMNVPKHASTVLIKGAGSDDAWQVGAWQFQPMPPFFNDLSICADGSNMLEWNGKLAFKCPKLVHSLNVEVKGGVFYFVGDHGGDYSMGITTKSFI